MSNAVASIARAIEEVNENLRGFERRIFPKQYSEWLYGPKYADLRVADWPLADPAIPLFLVALYLGVTLAARTTRPTASSFARSSVFKVLASLFSMLLACGSAYVAYETVVSAHANFGWSKTFAPFGNAVDPPTSGATRPSNFSTKGERLAQAVFLYYLSKLVTLLDSLVLIVKGQAEQLTFAHIYLRAATVFPLCYVAFRYVPGGDAWAVVALDSAISALVYAHQAIAAQRGAQILLLLRIAQYLVYVRHGGYLLFDLDYRPRVLGVLLLAHGAAAVLLLVGRMVEMRRVAAAKNRAAMQQKATKAQ
jgi:hypothetical protein